MSNDTNKCRFCRTQLRHTFADLGVTPLANSYLDETQLHEMEPFYPLHVFVCERCFLVQLPVFESPEHIFGDYPYFSSYSQSWLQHAKIFTDAMIDRFGFDFTSQVIEIASNDGYLLQYFKEKGVPVFGIEPAKNVAKVAQQAGIPTIVKFFGVETATELAKENKLGDLLIGNNVLAHVPDLNDFVRGLKIALKPSGIITLEFPHLLRLILENQFDTIYHEHFSYFSFITVEQVFSTHGLTIFDVEELSTHGGSLRIYARHSEAKEPQGTHRMNDLRAREMQEGLNKIETYDRFVQKVHETKRKFLEFIIGAKRAGKTIVGYGAAAKGNTLLNYCGVRADFIDYAVDLSPHKQNRFLPGTRIPIFHPSKIKQTKPDYLLVLPWNLKDEITEQMAFIRQWGGRFVVPIPEVQVY